MSNQVYSKAALMKFLGFAASKGLFNSNTAGGMKAASGKLLEDLGDADDVRKVDPATAAVRFNNRNSGKLTPASLHTYQKRLASAIEEFVSYTDNPTTYKGKGRPLATGKVNSDTATKKVKKEAVAQPEGSQTPGVVLSPARPIPAAALSFDYPLRADFLAQVVVPRDMTSAEASRLSAFIKTLAADFQSS